MDILKDPIAVVLEKSQKYIVENKKQVLIAVAIFVGFVGIISWYLVTRGQIQVNAHKDFVHAMESFQAPVVGKEVASVSFDTKEFKTKEEKWQKVEELFKRGYEKNKSAGLAPIFLAYQSEALLNQGKNDQAISILKKSIDILSSKEVKSYYQIKLALMQIDFADKKVQADGVDLLKELAVDDKSIAHDRALYYLGDYYWHNKKFEDAKNYWNQLNLKYGKSAKKPSYFVNKAKSKLKLISFKS